MHSLLFRIAVLPVVGLVAAPALSQIPNDDCPGAILVLDGPNGAMSNVGATDSPEPWLCGFGPPSADLWYLYVASCTGTATFDTCSALTTFDTMLQIYDGACGPCGALGSPACNDDSCGLQSSVTVPVMAGGVYYVQVGGYSGGTGTFELTITCIAGGGGGPGDDECVGATPVALGLNGPFLNVGYTDSLPGMPCGFMAGPDVWFLYVATCTGPHTFDTCSAGTSFDTVLQVLSGPCGPCQIDEGCNDDFCGFSSSVTANLIAGQLYYIRVGGYFGATGSFDLNVATGTNTGTITPSTTVSLCPSAATLNVTGSPNIGNTVVIDILGATGLGFTGFGFPPYIGIPLPCGCVVVSDGAGGLGDFLFVSSRALPIPCDPYFIGVPFDCQGIDVFPAAGGCVFANIPFGLTDIWTVTIG